MRTVLVCVRNPRAEQQIAACAIRMGLPQTIKAVNCASALFVELGRRRTDIVLVDVALAAPDPVKFSRAVRARFPGTGVLFAGAADPRTAAILAAAGALGVLRSGNADDLLVAFAQAFVFARQSRAALPGSAPHQRSSQRTPVQLSQREFQVLVGMSEGKHNDEIGRELFVSPDTVKTHAKRMYRKLGANDRAHAVAIALRSGLIA